MKILYLSTSSIPSRTANSIHVMKMCQAFSDNGHEVILFAPDKKEQYENEVKNIFNFYGIKNNFKIKKYCYLDIKKIGPFFYSVTTHLLIKKLKPDLVYGRDFIGCLLSAVKGYNTIFEAHEPLFENGFIYTILLKLLLKQKNLKKLVVISQSLKDLYFREGFNNKIHVAHDGADEIKDLQQIKNWKGRNDALQIGYFGHLYEGRGIDIIIELSNKMPDVDFHVVGGNNKEINYWKNKYKNTNLIFHGFVSPNMVYKYRNTCDILLAPYQGKVTLSNKRDTSTFMSPLKIFEYMSSKKAIIASDLPVLREVLNEKNAILVKCDNIEEWISAINKLKHKKIRNKLAQKSYKIFQNNFLWEERAKNVLK